MPTASTLEEHLHQRHQHHSKVVNNLIINHHPPTNIIKITQTLIRTAFTKNLLPFSILRLPPRRFFHSLLFRRHNSTKFSAAAATVGESPLENNMAKVDFHPPAGKHLDLHSSKRKYRFIRRRREKVNLHRRDTISNTNNNKSLQGMTLGTTAITQSAITMEMEEDMSSPRSSSLKPSRRTIITLLLHLRRRLKKKVTPDTMQQRRRRKVVELDRQQQQQQQ